MRSTQTSGVRSFEPSSFRRLVRPLLHFFLFALYSCQYIQAQRCPSRPSPRLHVSNNGSQRSVRAHSTVTGYTDIAYIHVFTYYRTTSRKGFTSVKDFIEEPDSRAQCMALEQNVKEFGLTYFGMKDRRQGVFTQLYEKPSPTNVFPRFSRHRSCYWS